MPHIDEDFYKSIGSEEETKEVIKACPRSSTMNYSPPPLNENITSAVKKTDTTLYGIHIALAQATRPLHNFVYRKYKEDSKAAKEDEGVMNIPWKPKQLAGNVAKPLFDLELMDKAISTINPAKKSIFRKPFQMRQQYGTYRPPSSSNTTAQTIQCGQTSDNPTYSFPSEPPSLGPPHNVQESLGATHGQLVAPNTDNSSSPVQEEAESGSQSGTDRGNSPPIIQESNIGGRLIKPGVLQSTLLYPQEDRAAEASLGFKKPEQVCSGKELQNGVSQPNLQVNQEEGLYDVLRSERRLPPHPDTQSLSKVLTFHLECKQFQLRVLPFGLSLSPHTLNKVLRPAIYRRGPEQAHEIWAPGKLRQVGDSADTNDKSPGNYHKFLGDDSQGAKGEAQAMSVSATRSPHAEATPRAQELLSQDNYFMEIDGPLDEISGPKPSIFERPVGQMELPVLSPRDTRDRGLYRCQRHGEGDIFRLQFLLLFMESITGVDAYQRQRAIDNIVRIPAPECCWSLCASLLRQHNDLGMRQEIWRSNGVVAFPGSIHNSEPEVWSSRRRHVCFEAEQEGSTILQQVLRQERNSSELIEVQMVEMEQSILLPSV
ncbi:hypothetical protein AYI69_g4527 [Smittium culicis]|uniref:Uncharacterized protein n=1 Tax=Smittium culicis TaxID=133412 RepID=A0A1R1YCX5_9FUNG|nr:hypothetical protein AYI69_g4527 [Smittium culicis]